MTVSPFSGKSAESSMLVNIPRLITRGVLRCYSKKGPTKPLGEEGVESCGLLR
jgi:hypothetical protein